MGDVDNVLSLVACNPGDLSSIDSEWCEDDNIRNFQTMPDNGCAGRDDPERRNGDLYAFYYDQRVCRTFADAFGVTLAYVAYIEAFATILFIVLLQKTGTTRS